MSVFEKMNNDEEIRGKLLGDISFQLMRISKKIHDAHHKPKDFGCGVMLFPSEIHTLCTVADNPECNTTELAVLLGVTKGAISQMVKKLEKKGLLTRKFAPGSEKQLMFTLTESGKIAEEGHKAFHDRMGKVIFERMKQYSLDEIEKYKEVNALVEKMIDEIH